MDVHNALTIEYVRPWPEMERYSAIREIEGWRECKHGVAALVEERGAALVTRDLEKYLAIHW